MGIVSTGSGPENSEGRGGAREGQNSLHSEPVEPPAYRVS